MYRDEKIDYTNYLKNKQKETNPMKLSSMKLVVTDALEGRGVKGHVSCTYYVDGNVLISVDGKYYGMFDTNTGNFFSGFVGDESAT